MKKKVLCALSLLAASWNIGYTSEQAIPAQLTKPLEQRLQLVMKNPEFINKLKNKEVLSDVHWNFIRNANTLEGCLNGLNPGTATEANYYISFDNEKMQGYEIEANIEKDDAGQDIIDIEKTIDGQKFDAKCNFANKTGANQPFSCVGYDVAVSSSVTTQSSASCELSAGVEDDIEINLVFGKEVAKVMFGTKMNSSNSQAQTCSVTATTHVPSDSIMVPPNEGGRIAVDFLSYKAKGKIEAARRLKYPTVDIAYQVFSTRGSTYCSATVSLAELIRATGLKADNAPDDNKPLFKLDGNDLIFLLRANFEGTSIAELNVVKEWYDLENPDKIIRKEVTPKLLEVNSDGYQCEKDKIYSYKDLIDIEKETSVNNGLNSAFSSCGNIFR